VAVPGGRASRRLLEILVLAAEDSQRNLIPPEIVTVGRLPELLYEVKRPFACEFTQQLAWNKALDNAGANRLKALAERLPMDGDLLVRLRLAGVLSRLHRELAAENLNFADVATRGADLDAFHEKERWNALAALQDDYLDTLGSLNLWDRQTARRIAIQNRECVLEKELVLAATVDLNAQQRFMLDQVADRVTALIFAPQELESRFDPHGCLVPEAWGGAHIPLEQERILIADDPSDQAARTVEALAGLKGKYTADQVTLGVPDEEVVPYLQQLLGQMGIENRYGAGTAMDRSRPFRLLRATADFLEGKRFESFAALIRHPDVQAWLDKKDIEEDWLSDVDRYHEEHLPFRMDGKWPKGLKDPGPVKDALELLEDLLAGFEGVDRPLGGWNDAIRDLLITLFGSSTLNPEEDRDHVLLSACAKLQEEMARFEQLPKSLQEPVKAGQALRLLLKRVLSERIPPLQGDDSVELLGWLELPLDDAEVLIVTGFNDGAVPSSLNADLFLPNQLRRALGIEDNERRFARDAYALNAMAASRKELVIIAGRRRANNDPLHPSRLLFACGKEEAARRVLEFFAPLEEPVVDAPKRTGKARGLAIPRPGKRSEPVTSMRVTEFRDYIECPYRYYLRHRLDLEALADDAEELDARGFGTLVHDVLRDFGKSGPAGSKDPDKIRAWLDGALERMAAARFGESVLAAVRVQIEQVRLRLHAFAEKQARWVEEGWRIEAVEIAPEKGAARLVVDDEPMILRGRIDRIDRHGKTGALRILDYKTSATRKTPEEVHRRQGEWIDLQLPLYRHLARSLGLEGELELGFIVLPQETMDTDCLIASWSPADLEEADRCAHDVIRRIRKEKFWPPAPPAGRYASEFSAICQEGHFAARRALDRDEGGDAS
jgi:hypothetical protein